jgi:uncharacterized protein YecT (DUF1311 family)
MFLRDIDFIVSSTAGTILPKSSQKSAPNAMRHFRPAGPPLKAYQLMVSLMRLIIGFAVLIAVLPMGAGSGRAQSAPAYQVTDCSRLTTQMELNQCADANEKSADTALNTLYRQLMAEETDAGVRQRLVAAERAWIAYRDKECAYQVGPQQNGGSIWPMEMSNCLEQLTAARIAELSKLRGCTAGVSACNPQQK